MPETGTQSTCEIAWPASRLGRISACWPGPQLTAIGAAPGAAAAVMAVDGAAATGVPELQPVAASAPEAEQGRRRESRHSRRIWVLHECLLGHHPDAADINIDANTHPRREPHAGPMKSGVGAAEAVEVSS